MAEWRIEPLAHTHERQGFDCGRPSLDEFLRSLASQYEKRGLGRTFVATHVGTTRVLGYYTMASGAIDLGSLPTEHSKKLPRHPVPAALIARLAVDRDVRGKGLGAMLLRDALGRSLHISEQLGIHVVVVDALDDEAKAFYQHFGFLPLTDHPQRLFLPLSTIRAASKKP